MVNMCLIWDDNDCDWALKVGEALTNTLQKPGSPIAYPEIDALVYAKRVLLPPKGEYAVTEIDAEANELWVELNSDRELNAEFQMSAVLEIANALAPGFSCQATINVPEDVFIAPGENPYFDNNWSCE